MHVCSGFPSHPLSELYKNAVRSILLVRNLRRELLRGRNRNRREPEQEQRGFEDAEPQSRDAQNVGLSRRGTKYPTERPLRSRYFSILRVSRTRSRLAALLAIAYLRSRKHQFRLRADKKDSKIDEVFSSIVLPQGSTRYRRGTQGRDRCAAPWHLHIKNALLNDPARENNGGKATPSSTGAS